MCIRDRYLRVKASRGSKILVKVRGPIEDYDVIGTPSEGMITFKDRSKETKRVSLPREAIIKYLGVYWCEVDEESGTVAVKDFSIVPGFDPVKFENYIVRSLTRPALNQKKDIIVYVALGLIVVLLIAVLVQLAGIKELIPTVASITGGNI